MSKHNFDSETDISGLDDSQNSNGSSANEGSRESESPNPSKTKAAYYNGFNSGGRYV